MRNFFEHQDQAWEKSAKFIALLVSAIAGTVIATGLVFTYLFVLLLICLPTEGKQYHLQTFEVFLVVCAVTTLIMTVSSLQKMRQLRAGGRVIAEDLGGEPIDPRTHNRRQRRLLNIVNEMAVASGIPAPTVYILPKQSGINAFAAGMDVDDAIVAVTQGCLQRLNRDQLQGVIAHEFSHILNGDMRLNMRLVGWLHGVLGITLFAEALLQTAHELMTTPGNHRDAVMEIGMAILLSLTGILLWPVGLIGTLLGTLVMSATSRQREFLADAYAVQLTRNPEGIAGALKVLAGCDAGSRVRSAKSVEASHFFFAPGGTWISLLLATHPPLAERIRRLEPQWDGLPLFEDIDPVDQDPAEPACLLTVAGSRLALEASSVDSSDWDHAASSHESAETADDAPPWSAATGNADEMSSRILATLDSVWVELVEDADGCQMLLMGLWLAGTRSALGAIQCLDQSDRRIVERLLAQLAQLDSTQQMLLFDLAIEQAGALPADVRSQFQTRLEPLLKTADLTDFATWSMNWHLQRCLGMASTRPARPTYGKLKEIQKAGEAILSMACHCGSNHEAMARYAFQRATIDLDLHDPEFWSRSDLTSERLDAALQLIAELAPRPKQQFLAAVQRSLSADHGLTTAEAQFVRAFCAALDLPIPAWLPGQMLTNIS